VVLVVDVAREDDDEEDADDGGSARVLGAVPPEASAPSRSSRVTSTATDTAITTTVTTATTAAVATSQRARVTLRGYRRAPPEPLIALHRFYTAPMRVPELSPRVYRRLTASIVAFLAVIIVTGAAVRLSNSGLGCDDWPNCNADNFVSIDNHHEAIEQLNRLLSGAIVVPIAVALLAAYRRTPRRRDLVVLSWVLLALFFGEAVLGGITVLVELAWVSVMGHFLLAIALVGVALTIHHRAGEPDGEAHFVVGDTARYAVRAVYAWTIWVLVAGTLVTAAGPHGGDRDAERLDWAIADVARLHGVSVVVLLGLVFATIGLLRRDDAPARVVHAAEVALATMFGQALIGYVQYFNDIPAVLVGFHVAGAVLVFGAVHQLQLTIRERVARPGEVGDRSDTGRPVTTLAG
jgi:cytochrome c oxidase assembly protein subunit 15